MVHHLYNFTRHLLIHFSEQSLVFRGHARPEEDKLEVVSAVWYLKNKRNWIYWMRKPEELRTQVRGGGGEREGQRNSNIIFNPWDKTRSVLPGQIDQVTYFTTYRHRQLRQLLRTLRAPNDLNGMVMMKGRWYGNFIDCVPIFTNIIDVHPRYSRAQEFKTVPRPINFRVMLLMTL